MDRINSADPRYYHSGWASAIDVHEGYPIAILVREEETTAREGVFTCRIDGGPPMASVGVYYPSENDMQNPQPKMQVALLAEPKTPLEWSVFV